jgi:hypothetical protein
VIDLDGTTEERKVDHDRQQRKQKRLPQHSDPRPTDNDVPVLNIVIFLANLLESVRFSEDILFYRIIKITKFN